MSTTIKAESLSRGDVVILGGKNLPVMHVESHPGHRVLVTLKDRSLFIPACDADVTIAHPLTKESA